MALNSKINLVDNLVLENVISVMDMNKTWTGTMTELNELFLNLAGRGSKSLSKKLPRSPSFLRIVINRIANRLRTRGMSVKFGRTNDRTRTRYVKFAR